MKNKYDFAGWVTKNDIRCSDGVTIKHDAFKGNDTQKVPLVWEHDHNDPQNVLGNVELENRDGGVYGYGTFNDTDNAKSARELISHGDISAMSIAANHIKKHGNDVIHGRIYEVSLVLAGANPGAMIDTIVSHSDDEGDQAIIYTDNLIHSAEQAQEIKEDEEMKKNLKKEDNKLIHSDEEGSQQQEPQQEPSDTKTVEEVINTLSPEQSEAVSILLNAVAEASGDDKSGSNDEEDVQHSNEGGITMKKNVFDGSSNEPEEQITHSELNEVLTGAIEHHVPSLKKLMANTFENDDIEHADGDYGITNIETLFPDFKNGNTTPFVLDDQNTASQEIVNAASKSPFSRVKNVYADLNVETARARGYIKGKQKFEQVYGVLTRETTPQTVYAKQKLDRDDIVDITDFDVVSWAQQNMRVKLIQELAKAMFVGDGRDVSDPDKISEDHIRPIVSDDDLYTMKFTSPTVDDLFKTMLQARVEYQGAGQPAMYVNPALLANLLLLKDKTGKFLFGDIPSVEAMAARLRVSKIVETTILPVDKALVVNLSDYQLGSTKGGEITSFDDFDIDFNQYKYLIETRLSGALKNPKSAILITVTDQSPAAETPASGSKEA